MNQWELSRALAEIDEHLGPLECEACRSMVTPEWLAEYSGNHGTRLMCGYCANISGPPSGWSAWRDGQLFYINNGEAPPIRPSHQADRMAAFAPHVQLANLQRLERMTLLEVLGHLEAYPGVQWCDNSECPVPDHLEHRVGQYRQCTSAA